MMLFLTNFFFKLVFILQLYEYNCQLKVFSPDDEEYAEPLSNNGLDLTNITDFKFSIKACANVHVIIQKTPTVDFYTSGNYIFIIGSHNGQVNGIRDAMHGVQLKSEDKTVLDCNAYKYFWISWKNGYLKMGEGAVLFDDERLACYVGPLIDYKYAFLMTGWGSNGCWNFDIGTRVVSYGTKVASNHKMIQGSGILTYTVKSKLECLTKCVSDVLLACACKLFSFNKTTKQCMVSRADITVKQIDDPAWKTWQLL